VVLGLLLSDRVLAQQVRSPGFDHQHWKNKEKVKNDYISLWNVFNHRSQATPNSYKEEHLFDTVGLQVDDTSTFVSSAAANPPVKQ
jgi:hypothetical protein